MTWKTDYKTYLLGKRNLASGTVTAYCYDAVRYLSFVTSLPTEELEKLRLSEIPFSQEHLLNFAAKRRGKVSECTIEHEIHGILAFWKFCHKNKNPIEPIPFKQLDIPIKCRKNPTSPLSHSEYSCFMENIYEQLIRIY